MQRNLIVGVLTLLLSTGAAVPASGQDASVILQMLDHLEKRLDKLEALRNKDVSSLQKQMEQAATAKGSGSVTVSGDSLYSSLFSQVSKLEKELAEGKKNSALPDSIYGLLVARLDRLEAQASQAGEGRPATGDKQPADDLLAELRGLASSLRETIQNGSKPDTKKEAEVFKPEVTGYLYYHHDASSGDGKTNSFDISRAYIGGKYRLSDSFSFRYLSDIGHETGGGKLEVFTKFAYLDWKLNASANLLFGLQGTLNQRAEKVWGYRVISKSPMEALGDYWGTASKVYLDRLDQRSKELTASGNTAEANALSLQKKNFIVGSKSRMSQTADLGFAVSIKPNQRTYLDFMVRNGSGFKKAEDDKYKNFSVRGGGYFLDKALHISGFMEVEPWEGTDITGAGKGYTNYQWDLFASYTYKAVLCLGTDINSKRFAGNYEDITAYCYSVFGNVSLVPGKLKALGRFDYYQAGFNEALSAGPDGLKTNANLYILGLDYMADKRVHIIPNVQVLSNEDSNLDSNVAFYVHMLVEL